MVIENILQIAGLLITGGVFGKLIDTFFLSKKDKIDANSRIIEQLQDLVISNINRQNDLQKDVDYWRREYNELHKDNESTKRENEQLKKQLDQLQRKFDNLNKKYNDFINKYKITDDAISN